MIRISGWSKLVHLLVELVVGDLLGEGGDQGLTLVLEQPLRFDQDLGH